MVVQSVELLLDADLDAAVRRQWRALVQAGLPSQARNTGATNAPHVTLAVAAALDEPAEAALPDAVAALPLPVLLGAPLVFGRGARRVLVRLVVPTRALLDLHAAVARAVDGAPGVPPNVTPDRWTPHVTLARGLSAAALPAALEALAGVGPPHDEGSLTAARRWDGAAKRAWLL